MSPPCHIHSSCCISHHVLTHYTITGLLNWAKDVTDGIIKEEAPITEENVVRFIKKDRGWRWICDEDKLHERGEL
jgi:hypothetical protein